MIHGHSNVKLIVKHVKCLRPTVRESIRGQIIKSWDLVCKTKHTTATHFAHVSKTCTELLPKDPGETAFNLVFVLLDVRDVLKSSSLERDVHLTKYKYKFIWREVRWLRWAAELNQATIRQQELHYRGRMSRDIVERGEKNLLQKNRTLFL